MNNRPHGNELLVVARRALLDEVLPLLPADKTYDVLMIANAMAIAARELEPHCGVDERSGRLIARFQEEAGLAPGDASEHALAALIRARAIPPEQQGGLRELLLALTREKLALSNPKHLRQSSAGNIHEQ